MIGSHGQVEFHKKGHAAARTKSPAHLKMLGSDVKLARWKAWLGKLVFRVKLPTLSRKWEEELECMEKIIAWLEEGKDVIRERQVIVLEPSKWEICFMLFSDAKTTKCVRPCVNCRTSSSSLQLDFRSNDKMQQSTVIWSKGGGNPVSWAIPGSEKSRNQIPRSQVFRKFKFQTKMI